MKIKGFVSAVFVTAYSIGAANAATNFDKKETLKAVTNDAIVSLQMLEDNSGRFVSSGVNRQLKKSNAIKFFDEPELTGEHTYVVIFKEQSAVAFDEIVKHQSSLLSLSSSTKYGAATSSATLKQQYSSVQAYESHLLGSHQSLVSKLNANNINVEIRNSYTRALNGFTIKVDQQTAKSISEFSEVKTVARLGYSALQSYSLPKDVGVGEVWAGNTSLGNDKYRGEGMVIGVLDTGINSDHVSFSDELTKDGYTFPEVEQFIGDCANADDNRCNNKLIGIRSYPLDVPVPDVTYNVKESDNFVHVDGEDYNGHGSHVASVAIGNNVDNVSRHLPSYKEWQYDGTPIKSTSYDVSGIAPHAQVISYQVCDAKGNSSSCPDEAVIKAIDDAILDDVDVINFSVAQLNGSAINPYLDAVELAFLNAHQANIVVVTAVGNSGFDYGSADHPSPWLLTVGVTDKSESYTTYTAVTDIAGGDEDTRPKRQDGTLQVPIDEFAAYSGYIGEAFNGSLVAAETVVDTSEFSEQQFAELISCTNIPTNTYQSTEIAMCLVDAEGNISYTNELSVAQTYQYMADQVKAAGAGGMIMVGSTAVSPNITVNYNDNFPATFARAGVTESETNNIFYQWVVESNTQNIEATATIRPVIEVRYASLLGYMYDQATGYGPGKGVNGEHLLPSVVAPGVNVMAASADQRPYNEFGLASDWLSRSGSSIATAVASGSALLVKQAHPEWSPSEIISALTLTAKPAVHSSNVLELAPDAYTMGAGLINVERAINTGLVMHESVANYQNADPTLGNISELNLPGLLELECFSNCSLTRTFTATKDATWRVEKFMDYASADITVTPMEFTLKKGETQTITVDFRVSEETFREGWLFDNWFGLDADDLESDIKNNEGSVTSGDIILSATDRSIPEVHLPIVVGSKLDVTNDYHAVSTDMNQGSAVLPMFTTDDVTTPDFTVYQPAIVEAVESLLKPVSSWDDMSCYLFSPTYCVQSIFNVEEHISNNTAYVEWIRVADGDKRLIAEAGNVAKRLFLDNNRKTSVKVAIGRDLNNNKFVDFRDEIICISDFTSAFSTNGDTVGSNNFCSISDPIADDYWVMYQWSISSDPTYAEFWTDELTTTISSYTGVVTDSVAENVSITGDVNSKEVTVHWDLDLTAGQNVYTAFNAIDNHKTINLDINRMADAANVVLVSKPEQVTPGATLDMALVFNENESVDDRLFNLRAQVPNGLEIISNSISVINHDYASLTPFVRDGNLHVQGTMKSAKELTRDYIVTTNETDALCRTPDYQDQTDGGYLDLGLTPITGSAMRDSEDNPKDYLLSPLATTIISNPRRLNEDGEPETDSEWAKRVHHDQWGPFNWMATIDDNGQEYIDREHVVIDLEEVFKGQDNEAPWITFFGNSEFSQSRYLYLFGNGFIGLHHFDSANPLGTLLPNQNRALDFAYDGGMNGSQLVDAIAPLWRANGSEQQFIVPFRPTATADKPQSGISVATLGNKVVVNYDNAMTGWEQVCENEELILNNEGKKEFSCTFNDGEVGFRNATHSSKMDYYGTDNYDFQVFLETGEAKNKPGEFEVIIAYNDIRRALIDDVERTYNDGKLFNDALYDANVGLVGSEGYKNTFGGLYHGAEYFNSAKAADKIEIFSAIQNDRVVCFDYKGPESAASRIDFKVKVSDDALVGEILTFNVKNLSSGLEFENQKSISVGSLLTIETLSSITLVEDSTPKFIPISVASNNLFVDIEFSDENINIDHTLENNQLLLTVTSAADYFTTKPVSVSLTLTNQNNPQDSVSTTFMVSVDNVNDAPEILFETDHYDIMSDEFVQIVTFTKDIDNDELSYHWTGDNLDQTQINNPSLNLSRLDAGTHTYTLTVSDGNVEVSKMFTVDVTQVEEAVKGRKEPSGGAAYWLMLLLSLSLVNRKSLKK
ncbi:S8 family serine peptidase [Thalassotalea crassostreae]|uniref:S8 family serine peptidase n=1 Tax=Thalassotalea crassostreae TaxID=1763536 RepID=UPI0008390011|nr:S8 family serine peptidase [Thalassotalea crassostreae]